MPPERIDWRVDDRLEHFLTPTRLDTEHAQARLRAVIASGRFETETERDIVWEIWKELRKY